MNYNITFKEENPITPACFQWCKEQHIAHVSEPTVLLAGSITCILLWFVLEMTIKHHDKVDTDIPIAVIERAQSSLLMVAAAFIGIFIWLW